MVIGERIADVAFVGAGSSVVASVDCVDVAGVVVAVVGCIGGVVAGESSTLCYCMGHVCEGRCPQWWLWGL